MVSDKGTQCGVGRFCALLGSGGVNAGGLADFDAEPHGNSLFLYISDHGSVCYGIVVYDGFFCFDHTEKGRQK